jgi:hypothetical protein
MKRRPVRVTWTGAAFVPDGNRELSYCQQLFGSGEVFVIDPEQERDMNSHRHYFAQLKEAWRNLPEELDQQYPDPDIFRKKLLVEAGYFHESEIVCDTVRDAETSLAFMASLDVSATIVRRGRVIKKYVAKSQSLAAMGRTEFQRSKWAVLELAANLIGVTPKKLERNAGRSA